MTVGELIEELQKYKKDIPVKCGFMTDVRYSEWTWDSEYTSQDISKVVDLESYITIDADIATGR